MGRRDNSTLRVEQYRSVNSDAAALWPDQPGDGVDDRSLARPRAAEQRGQAAPTGKMDVERKGAEPVLDIDFDHRLSLLQGGDRFAAPESRMRAAPASPA